MLALLLPAALPAAAEEQGTQKSLVATLNLYVLPSAGQTSEQQSPDESACCQWAVANIGSDPFAASQQAAAAQQQAAQQQQQAAEASMGG